MGISEQLRQKALDFVSEVEGVAKDAGYQAAKKEFDAKAAQMMADYDAKVKAAYNEGYAACKAELDAGAKPSTPDTKPEPATYSREKAVNGLLGIKGDKPHAFGIIDTAGNVYADALAWDLRGKPDVLGIGYTDGEHFLCLHPLRVQAAAFGGDGVNFGAQVHTTKRQWHKDTTAKENAAYDDFSGVSNTAGIVAGCTDSIAAKCTDYLPACGELRVYCKYYAEVDALLKAIGGDVLKTGGGTQVLWSSTCRDASLAWAVLFGANYAAQPAYRAKIIKLFTRQFIKL